MARRNSMITTILLAFLVSSTVGVVGVFSAPLATDIWNRFMAIMAVSVGSYIGITFVLTIVIGGRRRRR